MHYRYSVCINLLNGVKFFCFIHFALTKQSGNKINCSICFKSCTSSEEQWEIWKQITFFFIFLQFFFSESLCYLLPNTSAVARLQTSHSCNGCFRGWKRRFYFTGSAVKIWFVQYLENSNELYINCTKIRKRKKTSQNKGYNNLVGHL